MYIYVYIYKNINIDNACKKCDVGPRAALAERRHMVMSRYGDVQMSPFGEVSCNAMRHHAMSCHAMRCQQ